MAGGASTRARLQYLTAPESGGRHPRIRREVSEPLLLESLLCDSVLGTAPLDLLCRRASLLRHPLRRPGSRGA